jgi:hypothetical protein
LSPRARYEFTVVLFCKQWLNSSHRTNTKTSPVSNTYRYAIRFGSLNGFFCCRITNDHPSPLWAPVSLLSPSCLPLVSLLSPSCLPSVSLLSPFCLPLFGWQIVFSKLSRVTLSKKSQCFPALVPRTVRCVPSFTNTKHAHTRQPNPPQMPPKAIQIF